VLLGRPVAWATSNSSVVRVSSSGTITAVAAGTATITATSEGRSGTATVSVAAPPPGSLSISVRGAPPGVTAASVTVQEDSTPGVPRTPWVTVAASATAPVIVSGLAPGNYTVYGGTFEAMTDGIIFTYRADPQRAVVVSGQTSPATVAYALSSAALRLTVAGLPAAARPRCGADWFDSQGRSRGGTMVDMPLDQPRLFRTLWAGSGRLTCEMVYVAGLVYAPVPRVQDVPLPPSTVPVERTVRFEPGDRSTGFILSATGLPATLSSGFVSVLWSLPGGGGSARITVPLTGRFPVEVRGLTPGAYVLLASARSGSGGTVPHDSPQQTIAVEAGKLTSVTLPFTTP
jgi:hypothetical protein